MTDTDQTPSTPEATAPTPETAPAETTVVELPTGYTAVLTLRRGGAEFEHRIQAIEWTLHRALAVGGQRIYSREDQTSITEDPREAPPHAEGFRKRDGCADIHVSLHACDGHEQRDLYDALRDLDLDLAARLGGDEGEEDVESRRLAFGLPPAPGRAAPVSTEADNENLRRFVHMLKAGVGRAIGINKRAVDAAEQANERAAAASALALKTVEMAERYNKLLAELKRLAELHEASHTAWSGRAKAMDAAGATDAERFADPELLLWSDRGAAAVVAICAALGIQSAREVGVPPETRAWLDGEAPASGNVFRGAPSEVTPEEEAQGGALADHIMNLGGAAHGLLATLLEDKAVQGLDIPLPPLRASAAGRTLVARFERETGPDGTLRWARTAIRLLAADARVAPDAPA